VSAPTARIEVMNPPGDRVRRARPVGWLAAVAFAFALSMAGCIPAPSTIAERAQWAVLDSIDAAASLALEGEARTSPATKLYESAIAGDAVAQRRLGMMYLMGIDVRRNLAAAVDWLERAAIQDDCAANHQLGLLFLGGAPGMAPDMNEATTWLRRAIELQDSCES